MMRAALLAALVLLATPSSAQLIYAARPDTREPICVGVGEPFAWYHVGVAADEAQPIRVALTADVLTAGGGDTIYPGSATDLRGSGVCFRIPAQGGIPFVWIEKRTAQSLIHVDPLGQLRSVSAVKVFVRDLTPGVWHTLASNIAGMVGWKLTAEGGRIWFGSVLDTTKPPWGPQEATGLATPLDDGESREGIGNPTIFVWTDQPVGVRVRFEKTLRGFSW